MNSSHEIQLSIYKEQEKRHRKELTRLQVENAAQRDEIERLRMIATKKREKIIKLRAENAKLQADCTHLAAERNYWQNGYAEQQKFHTKREEELLLHISKLQTAVKWLVPGALNCGHECHYTYAYGFVPEAGCPEHDK